MAVRALFIDIDNTLCSARPGAAALTTFRGQSLLAAMIDRAVEVNRIARDEAERTVAAICDGVRWWHWTDFLVALDLEASSFWEHAFERERAALGPVEPELSRHLRALDRAGWTLFITSNNPSSGICHKLRLAGVAEIWGSPLFRQYLSPCDLHCMKAEPAFWRRCLAHTGLPADAVTVIGDNPHDDAAAPRTAGIARSVLYAPGGAPDGLPADLPVAADWAGIVRELAGSPVAAGV